jgi:hypothetical protein
LSWQVVVVELDKRLSFFNWPVLLAGDVNPAVDLPLEEIA